MPSSIARLAINGRRSLGDKAYEAIYGRIVTLAYEPGSHLEEGRLIEELGIGRTPVREALLRLAADLLVESTAGKGYIVRPLTLQNTKAAFAALQILELGVAELAVRHHDTRACLDGMHSANQQVREAIASMNILQLVRANSAFHDAYAACSANVYLEQGLKKIRCETNRLAYLSYGNEIDPKRCLQEHYASVIEQHAGIIDAVRNRDEAGLKQIIVEHIGIFKDRVINYLAGF